MTARIDASLLLRDRFPSASGDALGARDVLGPAAAQAITRRLDRVLPVGRDFASQLRTQVDLARSAERAG